MTRILLPFYFVLCLVNLASEVAVSQTGIWLTKPLLMPALAAWFYFETKGNPTTFRRFILVALLFSWLGDSLLMFVNTGGEMYFLAGLGSFLLAHLCYITAFQKYPSGGNGLIRQQPLLLLPFLLFLGCMIAYLWADLQEAFRIPVAVYSTVLTAMSVAAANMGRRVAAAVFQCLLAGALLFVLSDTLLALRKFKPGLDFPQPALLIMATYLAGQYLLARGAARANDPIR